MRRKISQAAHPFTSGSASKPGMAKNSAPLFSSFSGSSFLLTLPRFMTTGAMVASGSCSAKYSPFSMSGRV